MAFIPFANTLKVTVKFELNGKVIVTIYHVRKPTVIISADLVTIAQVFRDWWINTFAANFSSNITLTAVDILDITEEFGAFHNLPVIPPAPGGILIEALPNNVALVVSHYTAKSGRSFRGRNYHAGLTENMVDGVTVDPTLLSDIVLDYYTLGIDVGTAGFSLVVASREHDGIPRVTGVSTIQLSHYANSRVDTQRRRLPK